MNRPLRPVKQGLYDPQFEHDACGVGFVVNIKGAKSHEIIRQALTVLINLDHRGARGCEPNTGDGAGILLQLPHKFFAKATSFALPAPGAYGVGMLFLPRDPDQRAACQAALEVIIREEGQTVLGWREVPTDNSTLGETAKITEPACAQVFIERSAELEDVMAFERKLYVIRRRAENAIRHGGTLPGGEAFYFPSLSARTIVYKGMLTPQQVEEFFPELGDSDIESSLALVHSRFSTNTFPSWERAHPNRYLIHNGEINTLRGNVNWMHAREKVAKSDLFSADMAKVLPIIDQDGSDSAMFDNCFEFLSLAGRSLPHVAMMMVPEPWQYHESMNDEKRAFYEYHSCLMEPWDGPASMAFTDGTVVGAILDRNGLRPSRYYVTADDLVIMASEVGVLDIPAEKVIEKGRLQPGRMLLIDTEAQRIIADEEIKNQIASEQPYRAWLDAHLRDIEDLPEPKHVPATDFDTMLQRQLAFGYTQEDMRVVMGPMACDGVEPVGSMGVDTPLAVLSSKPQLLYNYFKQLFAQVTNPPIDSIREEIVTAMGSTVGPEGDLLHPGPENCKQISIHGPVITNEELAKLRELNERGFKAVTIPMLYDVEHCGAGLAEALETMFREADEAIANGATFLIISDRGVNKKQAPIPALLATAGLHHHLVRCGTRTEVGLIVESAEPREVQHFAVLVGYGAGAINPYFAFEVLDGMIRDGLLPGKKYEDCVAKFVKAGGKGVVKTMSKMGISTVQSYTGAQIFEAIGLSQDVVDKYFTWTPSRIEGIGLDEIAEEVRLRHRKAFPEREMAVAPTLDSGGDHQWRNDGEYHLINPETVHFVQQASWQNDYNLYKQYAALVNNQTTQLCTLRGMLDFVKKNPSISIDEVESIESICSRFKTGAMSFGSISKEAHEAMAIAMNRIGGQSNTGEGGEDARRFCVDENGDSRCSSIKQVASGRFGVTSHYLVNSREIQIKMAQGAKPGEGGQLPGRKVYPWVANVRGTTPGVGLISPPPHHDIYSIEDLAELIHDLKNANKYARICVKLVSEVGVGTIAAGVAKAHADVVLVSGYDGGTGASPRSSIRHAGLPWELGIAETHQTLVLNNLRSRIRVEADGKMMTGRDVVVAALLGAEEYGFATIPLVVLGCVMMRVCHQDTCPVGIATQNPELRGCFKGDPGHVVNYMRFVAQEIREWMAEHGFRTMDEMVGRTDMLKQREGVDHWKAKGVDLSPLLYQPDVDETTGRFCTVKQDHGLANALDNDLEKICAPALERGEQVTATVGIQNVNRVVGTMLGAEISRRYGAEALPEGTIDLTFTGSAGQSFGAFVPKGVTMRLVGDANDYLGKGLCGGKLSVVPPSEAPFVPEENIIIGNVAFFGATAGEAYIRGMAGERFCVRNSGVHAVVEGVGDHGCEYMTGGQAVIIGHTGRNFAAGMSGGIAYVLDEAGDFPSRCNAQMVDMLAVTGPEEIAALRAVIEKHVAYTDSAVGKRLLADWEATVAKFVKVLPKDYARMLAAITRNAEAGLSGDEAVMAAFVENSRDVARVGGN